MIRVICEFLRCIHIAQLIPILFLYIIAIECNVIQRVRGTKGKGCGFLVFLYHQLLVIQALYLIGSAGVLFPLVKGILGHNYLGNLFIRIDRNLHINRTAVC